MLAVLRLSTAEWRFALTSLAVKVVIFWIAQLVFCEGDPERRVCDMVAKGFIPCLTSFAVMDLVVIPPLRRRWRR